MWVNIVRVHNESIVGHTFANRALYALPFRTPKTIVVSHPYVHKIPDPASILHHPMTQRDDGECVARGAKGKCRRNDLNVRPTAR